MFGLRRRRETDDCITVNVNGVIEGEFFNGSDEKGVEWDRKGHENGGGGAHAFLDAELEFQMGVREIMKITSARKVSAPSKSKGRRKLTNRKPGGKGRGKGHALSDRVTEEDVQSLIKMSETLQSTVSKMSFSTPHIWTPVTTSKNVTVWKTHTDVATGHGRCSVPTIKAVTIIDGSPEECYKVFRDDGRVAEYNSNCVELEDLGKIVEEDGREVKINWCATGKFGPFKARDFV